MNENKCFIEHLKGKEYFQMNLKEFKKPQIFKIKESGLYALFFYYCKDSKVNRIPINFKVII
jgi:hypothetical protein